MEPPLLETPKTQMAVLSNLLWAVTKSAKESSSLHDSLKCRSLGISLRSEFLWIWYFPYMNVGITILFALILHSFKNWSQRNLIKWGCPLVQAGIDAFVLFSECLHLCRDYKGAWGECLRLEICMVNSEVRTVSSQPFLYCVWLYSHSICHKVKEHK